MFLIAGPVWFRNICLVVAGLLYFYLEAGDVDGKR